MSLTLILKGKQRNDFNALSKIKYYCSYSLHYCRPYGVPEIPEYVRKVCGRYLTKVAKFKPLLHKSSHSVFLLTENDWQVKSSSQSILASRRYQPNINQSTTSNRSVDVHPGNFYFLIIHYNSIFSTRVKRVCYSKKREGWNLCCSVLKLLMVI